MKNVGFRFAVVGVVLALMVYLLIPSIMFYTQSPEEQERIRQEEPERLRRVLNLGLDLQGGMRMVLEIDRSKLETDDKDVIDRAYAIIENRINQLGVAEPVLQKQGDSRIIVELPGIKDEQAARDVIGKTAQLEFNLVREESQRERAFSIIESIVSGKPQTDADTAAADSTGAESADKDDTDNTDQDIVDALFGKEADSTSADEDVSKDSGFRSLIKYYGNTAVVKVSDIEKVKAILAREDVRRALDRNNAFLWGNETVELGEGGTASKYKFLYYVKAKPEMTGDAIKNASASIDQNSGGLTQGQAKVNMEMNSQGARRFAQVTGANVNKQLAIVLDQTVYSAPNIKSRIAGGSAEISGSFTLEEARGLAIVLRAGALPAPVKIEEERIVGPSLGQDAIRKGAMAGLIGTAFVILFMIIYYKVSGIVALFALVFNMIIVLATMAAFNATLTLPGIAGLILLIGMGIDANVLIFERVREELKQGRTVRSAIEQGYGNALSAILDANITTIMTGLILMWKGTGPIRGFAVTLIIGITASLFTALFVSKLLMTALYQNKKNISI